MLEEVICRSNCSCLTYCIHVDDFCSFLLFFLVCGRHLSYIITWDWESKWKCPGEIQLCNFMSWNTQPAAKDESKSKLPLPHKLIQMTVWNDTGFILCDLCPKLVPLPCDFSLMYIHEPRSIWQCIVNYIVM